MEKLSSKRQLAAIMFTDIVGFTSLMGQGESHALRIMEKNKKIQMPLVEKLGGKWHKDLGDGALYSFDSSVKAVHCAMAIQQKINSEEDFQLRIGIHLGDVTFSNGDIFGDGVNIASRIETEAANGGICISESVAKSIKGIESIKIAYIGKRKLKNVSESLRIYQIVGPNIENEIRSKKSPAYILVPVLIILMLASGYIAWVLKPTPAKQVMRFSIMLKDEIQHIGNIALSHDGKTLIIGATMDGFGEMFVRPINAFESYRVPDGKDIANPTFSMDDSEVAFSFNGSIKVYSRETGTVSHFGDAVSISNNGITWIGDSIV